MAKKEKDPTEAMRLKASRYAGVDEGTACTQSSSKVNKKAFLFVGMQGGRCKAMFKLRDSLPEARIFAQAEPDRFDVGSTFWVTTRFTPEKPMPKKLWEKWLDESYNLSVDTSPGKKNAGMSSPKKKSAKPGAPGKSKTAKK